MKDYIADMNTTQTTNQREDAMVYELTAMSKRNGFSHETYGSKNIEWYTPPWVFELLRLDFDLDPCQPETRIPWIPAKRRYTIKSDGLSSPWSGRVWLNPPYGKHTGSWLRKMDDHRNGIALVFSRTDCAWFHEYIAWADAILFLKGRVKFVDGLGRASRKGAGSGSLLAAWGADNVAALRRLYALGHFTFGNGLSGGER